MKYITILTVNYINELMVIQSLLDAEEIEYIIKDEYTVQTDPFLSNAIGGIKLQVKEENVENAIEILKELNYFKEDDLIESSLIENDSQASEKSSNLNALLVKAPLINKIRPEWRLIVLVVTILAIIIGIVGVVGVMSIPTTREKLINSNWCVNRITYNGKEIQANTIELKVIMLGYCNENMQFLESGEVLLPGFDTYEITGFWELNKDKLTISKVDTLGQIYNHTYTIEFSNANLFLESESTTLDCSKEIQYFSKLNIPRF